MKTRLVTLNHAILFLCTSMYLGTGWSLVLFSFPIAPQLTVDTYHMQFVPQVAAATRFFTWMSLLMIAAAIVMLVTEWRTRYRWVPVVVLLLVVAATALTMIFIFPHNKAMSEGITDPVVLQETLTKWMSLNRIRVGLWTVQWLCMMAFFYLETMRARSGSPQSGGVRS
jgi:hypothetical protein